MCLFDLMWEHQGVENNEIKNSSAPLSWTQKSTLNVGILYRSIEILYNVDQLPGQITSLVFVKQ